MSFFSVGTRTSAIWDGRHLTITIESNGNSQKVFLQDVDFKFETAQHQTIAELDREIAMRKARVFELGQLIVPKAFTNFLSTADFAFLQECLACVVKKLGQWHLRTKNVHTRRLIAIAELANKLVHDYKRLAKYVAVVEDESGHGQAHDHGKAEGVRIGLKQGFAFMRGAIRALHRVRNNCIKDMGKDTAAVHLITSVLQGFADEARLVFGIEFDQLYGDPTSEGGQK
jgi:hypothetical protein